MLCVSIGSVHGPYFIPQHFDLWYIQHQCEMKLCDNCKDLDLWSPGFKITYELPDLMERWENCEVCKLLY
jgi:hypothetical protein